MTNQIENLFKHYGVRPTAMRLFIWKQIEQTEHPFSLGDMELWLDTVDKSTIFRTLTLFEEQGLLHSLDDGSGQKKYCRCDVAEVCSCHQHQHEHHHAMQPHIACKHVHAYCTKCQRTFCIRTQRIPLVGVPQGFEVTDINYVVRGICAECQKKWG
jgi:Fur family ferric uptake transcriptional regulator